VNATKAHSQRAQTQSRAARNQDKAKKAKQRANRINRALAECSQRLAFSPFEFGHVLGRSETWAYRQLYAGTVKAISDAGRLLIPRSELDRFLARAAEYNPGPSNPEKNGRQS
jgi:regulator of sirC expression with transglutaminase-like and TPR domain